jgi:hypothetical protein
VSKFLHDRLHGCRPDERLGACIPGFQILFDSSNEVSDTDEHATMYPFARQPDQRSIKLSQLELVGMK